MAVPITRPGHHQVIATPELAIMAARYGNGCCDKDTAWLWPDDAAW